MDTKIREIYTCLIQDTKYMEELNLEVEKKINQIIKTDRTEMDNQKFEEYRDKFFLIASIGDANQWIRIELQSLDDFQYMFFGLI